MISFGKLRGLQQLADGAGIFTMGAMDHRGSVQRLIDPEAPVSYRHLLRIGAVITEAS